MALFLLPMPASLPEEEVGVSDSFRMISFSFEAVRGEYLSRTQRLRKGWPFCPLCTQHKLTPVAFGRNTKLHQEFPNFIRNVPNSK